MTCGEGGRSPCAPLRHRTGRVDDGKSGGWPLADQLAQRGRVQVRGHEVAECVELGLAQGGEASVRRGGEVAPGELGHLGEEGPAERVILQRAVPARAPGTGGPAAIEESGGAAL